MRHGIPLLAGTLLLAGASAFAGPRGNHDMAGCGVGGMWVQSSSNGPQIWASSTNQSSGQIYAITTGTSGCSSEPGFNARRLERERFVASNYKNLSRELAQGRGEYAQSFAAVLGCKDAAVPALLSFTKGRYEALFPAEGAGPLQLLNALESEIAGTPALAEVCTL